MRALSLLYLPGCGSLPGGRKERFLQAFGERKGYDVRCLEYSKPLGSEEEKSQEETKGFETCLGLCAALKGATRS